MAWHSIAWHGVARSGTAWRVVAWRGVAWRECSLSFFCLDPLSESHSLFDVRNFISSSIHQDDELTSSSPKSWAYGVGCPRGLKMAAGRSLCEQATLDSCPQGLEGLGMAEPDDT
jgi:hypothetical protein